MLQNPKWKKNHKLSNKNMQQTLEANLKERRFKKAPDTVLVTPQIKQFLVAKTCVHCYVKNYTEHQIFKLTKQKVKFIVNQKCLSEMNRNMN